MDHSEPMSLGSPYNSPGHANQSYQASAFLPGFLMGDSLTPSKSPINSPPSGFNSSMQFSAQLPKKMREQTQTKESFNNSSFVSQNKINAPPVQSLADDFDNSKNSFSMTRSFNDTYKSKMEASFNANQFMSPSIANKSKPLVVSPNRQMINTQLSPTQVDPFYTQGESLRSGDQLDDTWVTIFGFPNLSASYVLQRFSLYGTIIKHKMTGVEGNYMHVKYESPLQAKKALSRNGKILPGNIMIGVTPCIDLNVISTIDENKAPQITSPKPTVRTLKQSIRPLTSAYRAASSVNQVTSKSSTPQKTEGFLTKAIDYVFG